MVWLFSSSLDASRGMVLFTVWILSRQFKRCYSIVYYTLPDQHHRTLLHCSVINIQFKKCTWKNKRAMMEEKKLCIVFFIYQNREKVFCDIKTFTLVHILVHLSLFMQSDSLLLCCAFPSTCWLIVFIQFISTIEKV